MFTKLFISESTFSCTLKIVHQNKIPGIKYSLMYFILYLRMYFTSQTPMNCKIHDNVLSYKYLVFDLGSKLI